MEIPNNASTPGKQTHIFSPSPPDYTNYHLNCFDIFRPRIRHTYDPTPDATNNLGVGCTGGWQWGPM
jgi:hypothetical protein